MISENNPRPRYEGKWAHNSCTKPGCEAQPYESCIWTGKPNERFPEPEGTPRAPHPSRKYHTS